MLQSEIYTIFGNKVSTKGSTDSRGGKHPLQALDEEHSLMSRCESVEEQDATFDGRIYP